jgi:16S rRNA (cytidine1402-2'-O)-methyltransferase
MPERNVCVPPDPSPVSVSGTLYIVATPIGNRADLTERARDTLANVDFIAAEDTRHTGQFLAQLGITTRLVALHEHNESARAAEFVAELSQGARIALVSDAGTPLISDPGFRLVEAASRAGVAVVAIPGACAAIAALSVAGLPTDRFVFEGFLPPRAAARQARLAALAVEVRTLVFYEAPHRIAATLDDVAAALGPDRRAVIARELTKMHETIYRGSLADLRVQAGTDPNLARGEAVLIVAGAAQTEQSVSEQTARLDTLLGPMLRALPLSQAVDLATEITGDRRNRVYERALELKRAAQQGGDEDA